MSQETTTVSDFSSGERRPRRWPVAWLASGVLALLVLALAGGALTMADRTDGMVASLEWTHAVGERIEALRAGVTPSADAGPDQQPEKLRKALSELRTLLLEAGSDDLPNLAQKLVVSRQLDQHLRSDPQEGAEEHARTTAELVSALVGLDQGAAAEAARALETRLVETRRVWTGFAAAVLLLAAFAGLMSWLLVRRHVTGLEMLARAMRRLANHDLETDEGLRGLSSRQGTLGDLSWSAAQVADQMRELVRQVGLSVSNLSGNATRLVGSAQQAAAHASQQAATVTEVTTTTEEILQTSRVAATSASEVVQTSEQAVERGASGLDAVEEAARIIGVVNERVSEIATRILQLSEQNEQIGGIVETVNDLAEQSNLLAVNASVEASKAGEQGRSFAVVAGEVRNLAEQSKRSTDQIRGILEDIQRATQSAVMATEEGNKRAEDGRRAIDSVRNVVRELGGVLEESSEKARQIAGAAAEQSSGVQEIARAMESVSQAGVDAASNARDLESSAKGLDRLARDLESITTRYAR